MAAPTATPPSVMLSVHQKTTANTNLYAPLHAYATKAYPSFSSAIDNDIKSISEMRTNIRSTSSLPLHLSHLLSYYRALLDVLPRFPISRDHSHVSNLNFTWHDAFKPSKKASQVNLHFEMASVIFNVGAVYSQIALGEDSKDPAGLRAACRGFQSAAGVFRYLRDDVAAKAGQGGGVTVDLTVECAGMLERLMLAQAQECYFEKAVADGKTPGTCSKIAQQVAVFYDEALQALQVPPLNEHIDRAWIYHLQLKAARFFAEACYRIGLDLHEEENISEEIARLKAGVNILASAKKSIKGVSQSLLDAVSLLERRMTCNLEAAVKENERVYLMRVTGIDSLAPLSAASLAKATDFGEILGERTECLFASLVPESSTKALSCYTEMVDDIIRLQTEKLQQASENSRVRLEEMGLHAMLSSDVNFEFPLDLKRDVEAVQTIGGPSIFEVELQQLKDLRRVNQELLEESEQLLQKEDREDAKFRAQYGTRWVRPQSATLSKSLYDSLKKFSTDLSQAADKDACIESSVKSNSDVMSILEYKPIESVLQSLVQIPMFLDGNEDTIMGSLKHNLKQLEALDAEGTGLIDMLKEIKRKDDILPKLMATSGSYKDIYQKEISKYYCIREDISKNVKTQESLLLQIQAQKDNFLAVSKVGDYKASLEKSYEQVATAILKFRNIEKNINEGLSFYVATQDAIKDLKQLCSDFVVCRNMESLGMIEDVQRSISYLNTSTD